MIIAPSDSNELFELAVRRSKKIKKEILTLNDLKELEINKVSTLSNYIVRRLRKIVLSTPFIDELHPFYRNLAETFIDIDEFKKCLSALYSASKLIERLSREYIRKIKKQKKGRDVKNLRKEFFGRTRSILSKINVCFSKIRFFQINLIKMPSINPDMICIIIAGPPNVGKSTVLSRLTRAKPEIREYPFTTKNILVGTLTYKDLKMQLIDTPGLLDRPLSERNPIELRSIIAMKYLNGPIVFIFDISEVSGFTIAYQLNVYKEIMQYFPDKDIIIVVNKIDVLVERESIETDKMKYFFQNIHQKKEVIFISALKNINLDILKEKIYEKIR